ncbi:hypothetical protein Pan14r_13490 [Crateriforma conspicua]|uniref:Uncharacterized protein n=1 Tax=Crateriforma conspicua TaxID=2527996 RepID=A0A5C5Y448_9PLAN|nr:hypothetical protein Pan14r_13490 [Crateriforma conspicua]
MFLMLEQILGSMRSSFVRSLDLKGRSFLMSQCHCRTRSSVKRQNTISIGLRLDLVWGLSQAMR